MVEGEQGLGLIQLNSVLQNILIYRKCRGIYFPTNLNPSPCVFSEMGKNDFYKVFSKIIKKVKAKLPASWV